MAFDKCKLLKTTKSVCNSITQYLTCKVFFRRSNARGTVARFNLQRQPAKQMVSISDQSTATIVQTGIHDVSSSSYLQCKLAGK